jgi:hypothetical protein
MSVDRVRREFAEFAEFIDLAEHDTDEESAREHLWQRMYDRLRHEKGLDPGLVVVEQTITEGDGRVISRLTVLSGGAAAGRPERAEAGS